jgi:hypothetical protein
MPEARGVISYFDTTLRVPFEPLTPARTRQLMAAMPSGCWEAELERCRVLSDEVAELWRRSSRAAQRRP